MERKQRRWWTRGITWVSLVAISGALLSALFQLAVALAPGYRDDVAHRASLALGQPVQVDALALRWRWLWPLLELKGVRLLATEGSAPIVDVDRIRLGFDLGELVRGNWIPAEVEIQGVELAAEITREGEWRLRGRSKTSDAPHFDEIAKALKRFARLRAERVALTVTDLRDAKANFSALLQRADLRLDEKGFELRAELQAPQLIATRLRLRAGITGDLAQPTQWQGRWTLDASGLAPGAPLHRFLPALARVQWQDASLTAAGDWAESAAGASELSLRAKALTLQGASNSSLRNVDLGLHYRPSAEGGTLDVVPLRLTGRKGVWPTTTARLDWRREAQQPASSPLQWRINSDFLRLDDLGPWVAAFAPANKALPAEALSRLRGDITALAARWQQGTGNADAHHSLHARFTDLALHWPGHGSVEGLRGEISSDDASGRAQLQSQSLGFEWPRLFAAPVNAKRFAADAQWRREGAAWQLTMPRLEWSLLGSEGQASAELRLAPGASPELKLQSRFDVADVAALMPLMPLRWGQSLKDWLERAVVRGRIAKATLAIDGPLADFPFHKNPTGHWSLQLPLTGARLQYAPNWPGVDQLAATLNFAGNGLRFETQRGNINGVTVTQTRGGIADFADAPLVLDGKTVGEAPYYFAFLRASPLATRLQALLSQSEAEGPAEADVHLEIPLHSSLGQKTVVHGSARLLGNTLRHRVLDRPVQDITGTLSFGTGVAAESLQARFYDLPVTARIAPNAEGFDEIDVVLRIDPSSADGVAAHYLPRWLLPQLQGAADWRVAIPLSGPHSGHVLLSSNLQGTAIKLPTPLNKSADESWPLKLDLSGDEAVPLTVLGEIPGRFGLGLRFMRSAAGQGAELRGLSVRLGTGSAPTRPLEDGWRLTAAVDALDPGDWRQLIAAILNSDGGRGSRSEQEERLPFLGADLVVQRLRLAGYELPPSTVSARREYGGYTANVQGGATRGQLKLSAAGDALSARFESLQLTAAPKLPGASAVAVGEPLDPTQAPTLDLAVQALTIGGHPFGALTLATERSANGQRLRHCTLDGGIATLKAEGEWRRSKGMTEAQARFTVASDDLASTLQGLGFAATVAGRNAVVVGDLTWPAAVRGFDWAQGRGTVSLAAEDGALRTVEPGGTSRVLGLFNFYALPRRLTLDFGDVVSQGLGFDRVEGHYQLANGVAHTDDLSVRGPSVRIEVRGDIGLAARDYNQSVTVTPNTKGITLGALLLGGAASVAVPVLPLIAVIANQVIDKPLGQVTKLSYGLTGSWDNPEFKKLADTSASKPDHEATKP